MRDNNSGFTLMEVVVGLAVFSVALIVVSDIFIMTQRAQNNLAGSNRVQADARYVMELVTREVRMNMIDYDGVRPADAADPLTLSYLPLTDVEGNTLVFMATSSPSICEAGSSGCLAVKRNNSAWASLTPREVNIVSATFYIYPDKDPFSIINNQYPNNSQPRVTIAITSQTVNSKSGESSTQFLQTTASSRVYKRF